MAQLPPHPAWLGPRDLGVSTSAWDAGGLGPFTRIEAPHTLSHFSRWKRQRRRKSPCGGVPSCLQQAPWVPLCGGSFDSLSSAISQSGKGLAGAPGGGAACWRRAGVPRSGGRGWWRAGTWGREGPRARNWARGSAGAGSGAVRGARQPRDC